MPFPNDPATVEAPSYTGGSQLGDFLAGVGGSNMSRSAIGLQIANGQAMAGYRSAQTELALQKAQEHTEREAAMNQLQDQFIGNGMKPSAASAAVGYIRATGRDPLEVMKMFEAGDELELGRLVSDPNTPEAMRVAAMQRISKKLDVGQSQNVGDQLVNAVQPGQPAVVTQTPVSQSVINRNNAEGRAADARAAGGAGAMDPEIAPVLARFIEKNPSLAGNLRSLTTGGGPLVGLAYMADQGDVQAQQILARRMNAVPGAHPAAAAPAGAGGAPAPVVDHGAPVSVPPAGGAPVAFDAPVTDAHSIISPAPGVSLKEQAGIRTDFGSGKGASQTTFVNTMMAHSRLFDMLADEQKKADAAGNFTPSNAFNNLWNRTFGKSAPTNIAIAGSFLGREAVRATVNSGAGTGEERELQIPKDASADQMHDAANTIRSLASHQLRSLDNRARRGGVNILQLLDPQTRSDYIAANAPQPAPGAAPAGGGGVDLASMAAAELARRSGAH
jgi:hypothetical protein